MSRATRPLTTIATFSESAGYSTIIDQESLSSKSQRPINPPPYRLDFEPFTSAHPDTKEQRTAKAKRLHQEHGPKSLSNTVQQEQSISSSPPTTTPLHDEQNLEKPTTVRGVVYMLHGWAQNVHVFSNRARKLTKRLNKAGYKVVFLQGPHRLPPVEGTPMRPTVDEQKDSQNTNPQHNNNSKFSREYAYAWFLYDNEKKTSDTSQTPVLKPSPSGDFEGMDDSLNFLENELRADRTKFLETRTTTQLHEAYLPPCFLLGFSQGAVLVHKIATLACGDCAMRTTSRDFESPWLYIQKCILVSGFSFTTAIGRSDDRPNEHEATLPQFQEKSRTFMKRKIMPSFHVVGKKDSRVSPSLTLELHDMEPCFCGSDNKVLWEHARGHVLPQDQKFSERLLEFLAKPC